MFLSLREIIDFNRKKLEQFLDLQIPEGLYLDYKSAIPEPFDKNARREFLKDVTAFANSAGGHLIIGCEEPEEGVAVSKQIVGLSGGAELAKSLEQLTITSVDPRISGTRFVAVDLENGKHCILVHVPPSMSRPHMVVHSGHRSFYYRNSESSVPMTTHEVREAVLRSATAISDARLTISRRYKDTQERFGTESPIVLLQAVPLIAPDKEWDVLSTGFEEIIRGGERRKKYRHFCDLATGNRPRPTIEGISACDNRTDPTWEVEIHRNGYVSTVLIQPQLTEIDGADKPVVHSGYTDFFKAFFHLLGECLDLTGADVPYITTAIHPNAGQTHLWTNSLHGRRFTPYDRATIQWPEHIRETGQNCDEVADRFVVELFYAFGFASVTE